MAESRGAHSHSFRPAAALGLGTSGLHGGWARRTSLRLLDAAYDAGIRHIDTAPLYGLGNAEEVVGRFLALHQDVTVTTKFGLFPLRQKSLLEAARFVARPLAGRVPALKRVLLASLRAASASNNAAAGTVFKPQAVQDGVNRSLRALRRERIDMFLLHEALATDLTDELRGLLEDLVSAGKIATWGLGSSREKLAPLLFQGGNAIPVLQFDFSVRQGVLPVMGSTAAVTHGALSDAFSHLAFGDRTFVGDLAAAVGCDVSPPGALARIIVGAALAANPDGMVLFTSKREEHIAQMAQIANSPASARLTGRLALDFFKRRAGIEIAT